MNKTQFLLATALGTTLTAMLPVSVYAQHDWSGPYVGASVAGIITMDDVEFDYDDGFKSPDVIDIPDGLFGLAAIEVGEDGFPTLFSLDGSGFGISLNAGYNIQNGNLVYGVEADATVFANGGSDTVESEGVISEAEGGLDALLALRARAGVSVDRLLFYVTAGPTIGKSSFSTSVEDTGKGGQSGSTDYSGSTLGVAVGAGAEYALTENASIKLEGLYYAFGDIEAASEGGGPGYTTTFNPSSAVVRVGINVGF